MMTMIDGDVGDDVDDDEVDDEAASDGDFDVI